MRIISGEFRGRRLKAPKGNKTRPTEDMTKEALFNIIGLDIVGSVFVDLFAGSGSIGIEALSRGASFAYFNDRDISAYKTIRENLNFLSNNDNYMLSKLDFKSFLLKTKFENKPDIIFIDPPYEEKIELAVFEIIKNIHLFDDTLFILETTEKYSDLIGYELLKEKKYGKTNIYFYKRSF